MGNLLIFWWLVKAIFGRGGGAGLSPDGGPSAVPPQQNAATTTPLAQPGTAAPGTPPQGGVPSNLPGFPSGWEADEPVPPEVVARANALLSSLWSTGAGTKAQEQTGGRWITYVATQMGDKRGVVAYRVKGAPKGLAGTSSVVGGWLLDPLEMRHKALKAHQQALRSQHHAVRSQLHRQQAAHHAAKRPAPPAPRDGEGDPNAQNEGDELPSTSPDASPTASDAAPAPPPAAYADQTDASDEAEGDI